MNESTKILFERKSFFQTIMSENYLSALYRDFDKLSAENKAAHLLYFIVKNHSFADGYKRIAAFLFLLYLERNRLLYSEDGFKKIEVNTLVALTLMIAE